MATLLAHIQIQPGKEDKWEAIMRDMVHHTFGTEEGVIRYEYWKGQEPLSYYCLLSFKDKWAFYHHQMSDHHEGHDFADVLADIHARDARDSGRSAAPLVQAADAALLDTSDLGIAAAVAAAIALVEKARAQRSR